MMSDKTNGRSGVDEASAAEHHRRATQLLDQVEAIGSQFRRLDPANWQADEAATLHRLAHRLTGAAGASGMYALCNAARALAGRLSVLTADGPSPTGDAWDNVAVAVRRLERVPVAAYVPRPDFGAAVTSSQTAGGRSPAVYVLEDDPLQAKQIGEELRRAGFRASVFGEAAGFRTAVRAERPDAAVMDIVLPDGDEAGIDLISELGLVKDIGIPVVVVSARDDLPARLAAFRAGASRYLVKPVVDGRLAALLNTLIERQPDDAYRVLMVDDEPLTLELNAALLRSAGMDVRTLSEPLRTLDVLEDFKADVVLLDVGMPDVSGPEIAAVLRERDAYQEMPILFLSAETDMTRQLTALNLGGDDFLVKPVRPAHLVSAVTARARRARQAIETTSRLRSVLYERERERLAMDRHAIVSVTDGAGTIQHVNDKFCEVSGYSREDLIGQNHRIVNSGHHSREFFRDLWRTISRGEIWKGEICNQRSDGSFYWVESTIVPFLDDSGVPYQFISIRTEITRIKEAEGRLRLSQDYANIGTWDWDIQTGELFWSQRIAPLFGYPEGTLETTYENFLKAVHPEDRQTLVDAVTACVEKGVKYDIEHRCIWPDGAVRWLQEIGDVVRDRHGRPLRMLGVVQDITDRKKAELALAKERGLLEEAQRIAKLGNWTVRGSAGDLDWSPIVFEIFGVDPASFVPTLEAFHNAVHPDDRSVVRDAIRKAADTGYYEVVHRIVRPDGEVRHLHERARVELDAIGNQMLRRGIVQDVTAMKAAEAALLELNLRQNEQLNAAHCLRDITMYTLDDGLDDRAMLAACIDRIRTGHGERGSNVRIRHGGRVVATQGFCETPWRLSAAIPFFEDSGSEIELFRQTRRDETAASAFLPQEAELLRDIARQIGQSLIRREDRRALVLAKEEAEAANRAKSDFLSSMSHELRTPLNAILGFAQVLEIDDLDADQLDSVQTIRKSGQHLLRLINEILDLARVESGHLELSVESVDLVDVLDGCASLVAPMAHDRGIEIRFGRDPGIRTVKADHTRLKQVLVNLMSNAVKYNRPAGSVTVTVSEAPGGYVRIAVIDTGPGIPADRVGQLFTPFNRLGAEHTEVEGTGIGLVISKRLVEAMDGRVGVESRQGVGSTFWIELPAAVAAPRPGRAQAAKRADETLPAGKVLYIEDNPANLKLIRQTLARHPQITLLEADNGFLGLDLARAHRPDLILLDINMPGMDGLEVLARLRADPMTRAVPAVAISAAAMAKEIERAMAAGFRAYLTKPIDIGELLRTVGHVLSTPDRRSSSGRRISDAVNDGDSAP